MNKITHRRLTLEGLETRKCFAVDVDLPEPSPAAPVEVLRHNFKIPTDVNQDGLTSPLDALSIINELNRAQPTPNSNMMSDTNGDGLVSPLDVLIVINRLNASPLRSVSVADAEDSSPTDKLATNAATREEKESKTLNTDAADLLNDTIADSRANQESIVQLLGRLRDLGLVDLGSFDLDSLDLDSLDHGALDSGSDDLTLIDWSSLDLGSFDLDSLNLDSLDLDALDLNEFISESLDVGNLDLDLLGRLGGSSTSTGNTYDPTDDNGNDFFLERDQANSLISSIEAELRIQLKLEDTASIQVAVFANGDETQSGTWRYLTEEGISIWGNWRQSADELRLFLSNVEEENRIYGQYPDGSFLYFSWVEQEPVGFYFTPLNESAVDNPVPSERYTTYFDEVGGDVTDRDFDQISAFFGDVGGFNGVQPIENLISDLYAIQLQWNAEWNRDEE